VNGKAPETSWPGARGDTGAVAGSRARGAPWGLWVRQGLAVVRLEVRKTFLSKRSLPVYLLAMLPVLLFLGRALFARIPESEQRLAGSVTIFGVIFQTFILHVCVYFGCVAIFSNLFRGEVLDRSLHYYFLAPVRREVVVIGKYVSGFLAGSLVFGASTLASALLLYVPHGRALALEHLFHGPGLSHIFWYLVVTTMACLGYGAVFLTVGLYFRNPLVAAVLILGWESIIFLLPPLLKKISVTYYLQSLCPFQINQESIAILASAAPVWMAIPGLLAVTGLLLLIAARRSRTFEVVYGAE